jgi:hypothetical protein
MPGKLSRYSDWLRAGLSLFGVSIPGGGWEFLFYPPRPHRLWGPSSLLSNGYWGLSLEVKWLKHDPDYSPPSTAEVKNAWRYTSNQIRLHDMVLVKHRDNFTFTFMCRMECRSVMDSTSPKIES